MSKLAMTHRKSSRTDSRHDTKFVNIGLIDNTCLQQGLKRELKRRKVSIMTVWDISLGEQGLRGGESTRLPPM